MKGLQFQEESSTWEASVHIPSYSLKCPTPLRLAVKEFLTCPQDEQHGQKRNTGLSEKVIEERR